MATLLIPAKYPAICELVRIIDDYLRLRHPRFFGDDATYPVLPLKPSKVIHDSLWGTNSFSWQELAIIDSPLLQRLRGIHQTGLAFQVYPSAHHTRFEHSLGVAVVASRVFDSLLERQRGKFRDIVKASTPGAETDETTLRKAITQLRLELRLAALLHDTGHSLFSHSSEQVFEHLDPVKNASKELAGIVSKKKGAGEAIAFAFALSDSVRSLMHRAKENRLDDCEDSYDGPIDWNNVALMIVGRTRHPALQFLADIISSGFDADKLDYLLRDATCAGLPLRYDFERYFYAVQMENHLIGDGESELKELYGLLCNPAPPRRPPSSSVPYDHYETHRLRLPAKAMNTIEQIVICKLMLFSYIYHHPKVRTAEGLLVDLLNYCVTCFRSAGQTDEQILIKFLDFTDAVLTRPEVLAAGLDSTAVEHAKETLYRIQNRLLPREVYRIGGAIAEGTERALLADFLTSLQDKSRGQGGMPLCEFRELRVRLHRPPR